MKGFKSSGKKSMSGHKFPTSFGFGPSSGKVQTISSYTRRTPAKKAPAPVAEAPTFAGGGVVGMSPSVLRQALQQQRTAAQPVMKTGIPRAGFARRPIMRASGGAVAVAKAAKK
jgi:hypothetical protein